MRLKTGKQFNRLIAGTVSVMFVVSTLQGNILAAVEYAIKTPAIIIAPTLVAPSETPDVDAQGRLAINSVRSYTLSGETKDMDTSDYSSRIATRMLTDLGVAISAQKADATAQQLWDVYSTLSWVSTYTGVKTDPSTLIAGLNSSFVTHATTVYDMLRYSRATGHQRYVVFLGTDNEWYVLDPITTQKATALTLRAYLHTYTTDTDSHTIMEGYNPASSPRFRHELTGSTSTGSTTLPEHPTILARSTDDIAAYATAGLITTVQDATPATDSLQFLSDIRYEGDKGTIAATLTRNMIVKTADHSQLRSDTLVVQSVSTATERQINSALSQKTQRDIRLNSAFVFGSPTQHLLFSQPVAITVPAENMPEGKLMQIWVQHTGQARSAQGLTSNPTAVCRADGSVAPKDQATQAPVISGSVTFYTCGASTFAIGYVPAMDLPNNNVNAIAQQSDGKIIIGGAFTTVGGIAKNRLARMLTDKSLDTSFDPNVNNTINSVLVQADGKVVFGGAFTGVGGVIRNRLARVNSDGSLDTAFNPNINGNVASIIQQSDGKLVVAGAFTTVSGAVYNRIARLNTNGTVDNTFNPNLNNTASSLALQSDGKIIVGGTFTTVSGAIYNRITRLTTSGTADNTFNPNLNNTANALALQSDGKIIVGGTFTTVSGAAYNRAARLNTNGTVDNTFNPNLNNTVSAISVQTDGSIILGGIFTTVSGVAYNRVSKVNSSGVAITTFNPNAGSTVSAVIFNTTTNTAILGGAFTTLSGVSQTYLGYFTDTIPDTIASVRPNSNVNALATQSDGKVLLGGAFTTISGVPRNRLARMTASGQLDTGYNPNVNNTIAAIAVQSDGKALIGGIFTTVSGVVYNRIARINTDGTADNTYKPNANSTVSAIALQSDGKAIIGGAFTTISGATYNRIARLNTNGTVDNTFNPNLNNSVTAIAVQTDGKILIGGTFTTVSGATYNRLARLNTNGTADTTFNPNINNTVNTIALQADGKILIGGTFTTVSGATYNRIARLNTNGTADTTFNPNANNAVAALKVLGNGDIIAGGSFTGVGGITRSELVKFFADGSTDTNLDIPFLAAATTISAFTLDNENNLIVGGSFTNVDGNATTPYIATIGLANYIDTKQAMLWLDASNGTNCTSDGCAIASWRDKAYSKIGAQSGTANQPIYQATGLNFNPTIQFLGAPTGAGSGSFDYLSFGTQGLNITNKMSVFVVHNLRSTGEHYMIGLQNGWTQRRFSNSFLQSNKGNSAWTGGLLAPSISSMTVNNTSSSHFVNGAIQITRSMTGGNFVTGNALWVGGTEAGGNYSTYGDIAEIIVYNRTLTGSIRMSIESYLAMKYGITMSGVHYLDGSGGIIWDATANASYSNNIMALGRDSHTTLDQRIATTTSSGIAGAFVIATTPDATSSNLASERTSLSDMTYLILGDNAAGTGFTDSYNSGGNNRIPRIWKVENTGVSTGIVFAVQSGAIGLPLGATTSGLVLVVSTDTTFTSGDTIVPLVASGTYLYATTTLPDGAFVSIAHTDLGFTTISAPSSRTLPSTTAAATSTTVTGLSLPFMIQDWKGSSSGYSTTLAFTALTSSGGDTIPLTAISVKADTLTTFSGAANPSVIIDSGLASFTGTIGTLPFISRALGSGGGIVGNYGATLELQVIVPPYSSVGLYTGNITYTLIEN